jgi:hypothetical protein
MNPYGYYRSVEGRADGPYPSDWWEAQRRKVRPLLHDGSVRIRAALLERVDRFVEARFSEQTLGVQLRGSDKFDFGAGPNLGRKIPPEEYFPHIDAYLTRHPACGRIFVATDQRQWLQAVERAYPDRVISYSDRSLSDSEANRFHDADEKAARGAEVIIDALLLSRCDHLIKCHAAVGEMALVLNPRLDCLDLNYVDQRFEASPRPARTLAAPAIRQLCTLWRALSEGGLGLSKVSALDGDQILVGGGRPLFVKDDRGATTPSPSRLSLGLVSDALSRTLLALGARCFAYAERDIAAVRESPRRAA